MRDFIQNKLRVLLEGRMATYSKANPSGPIDNSDTTQSQLFNAVKKINQAKTLFNSLSREEQQMLGDVYTGDGLYEIQLSKNGDLRGKENRIINKAQLGTYNDPNPNKRYFYVAANRGISHPEYDDDTRIGNTVGVSPMADAILKVRIFMGDDIISFLRDNMGYIDDKGEEIRTSKMTPDEIEKLKGKEDIYSKRSKTDKGYFGDESSLRQKQSELIEKKYKSGGLSSDEEAELKNIKNTLKGIEKERNVRRSSNI